MIENIKSCLFRIELYSRQILLTKNELREIFTCIYLWRKAFIVMHRTLLHKTQFLLPMLSAGHIFNTNAVAKQKYCERFTQSTTTLKTMLGLRQMMRDKSSSHWATGQTNMHYWLKFVLPCFPFLVLHFSILLLSSLYSILSNGHRKTFASGVLPVDSS